VWAVVAAVVLCCAGVVAVPVVWLARQTIAADEGETTPAAAVNVYLLQLDSGEELGLRRVLAGERRDELLDQWRAIRRDIERTDPRPSKLENGPRYDVDEDQGDGQARVAVDVRGVWWQGNGLAVTGTTHPWRFELRRDSGGWRVWSVEPHPWCGGHVRADACR
jgi:hypothetical protein